jgi:hypothetical protein
VISRVVLVESPTGRRSDGLNRLIAAAASQFIVRVDARSRLPSDYVARCIHRLASRPEVGVVGGVQLPCMGASGLEARGIARTLGNPWMLGGARYRRLDAAGPVDTVYLGAFRRHELRAMGGYDERLTANEDFDLCLRYRERGALVWLEGGLAVGYESRARVGALWAQYHAFGRSKAAFWRATGRRPNARQAIALAGTVVAAVGLAGAVRRGARAVGMLAGVAATGLVLADHLGEREERDPRVRLVACAAHGVVTTAWVSGVVRGLVSTRRQPGVRSGAFASGDGEHALEGDPGPARGLVVDDDVVDEFTVRQRLEAPGKVRRVDAEHRGARAYQRVE